MNKLSKNNIFNIVFIIIFIGLILSFSLLFWMISSINTADRLADGYFNGESISRGYFSEYDDLCLKNKKFYSMIIESEYRIFGNIRQGNVIKGKNGFLFDAGENSLGYNYVLDYIGEYELSEAELEVLYQNIELRQKVYQAQGRHYVMAVIPNSQTVYDDHMPEQFIGTRKKTVLEQLTQYIDSKGTVNFIDLTDILVSSKGQGLLYNNTENSINALGAYYVYQGIMNTLPEELSLDERILPISDFKYYTHFTEGKTLADRAGLSLMLENETVSMSNENEFMYSLISFYKNFETTYVKSSYKDKVSMTAPVLIELTNEWDKIQLMPYFSNTFGTCSYKTDHTYIKEAVENSNPLIVVQVIHEDELKLILNDEVKRSYISAVDENTTEYKTRAPQAIEYTLLDDNSICISGIVERDSEVQIFGEGFEPKTIKGFEGQFFSRIDFTGNANGKEVFIKAKSPDKASSEPISLVIFGTNNIGTARDVFVGENSMLYRANYDTMYELPDDEMLLELEKALALLFDGYAATAGKDTEIIFAMIPEKLSVYTYDSYPHIKEQQDNLKNIKIKMDEILSNIGVRGIDLSNILRENCDTLKLFYQTDNGLTDMAYYYMYYDLISVISENFPRVTPVALDSFAEYSYPYKNGTLAASLGFDMSRFSEIVTKIKFTNTAEKVILSDDGAYRTHRQDASLPNAVVLYDEMGTPMLELLAEHFNIMYAMPENSFDVDDETLLSVRPDYIIYLCAESNIDFNLR